MREPHSCEVVAAIRYISNGTYLSIIKEMLEKEVAEELKPLKARVVEMVKLYEQAMEYVKEAQDQETHDFLARRLYNMTGDIIMSLLILEDATRSASSSQRAPMYTCAWLRPTSSASTLTSPTLPRRIFRTSALSKVERL